MRQRTRANNVQSMKGLGVRTQRGYKESTGSKREELLSVAHVRKEQKKPQYEYVVSLDELNSEMGQLKAEEKRKRQEAVEKAYFSQVGINPKGYQQNEEIIRGLSTNYEVLQSEEEKILRMTYFSIHELMKLSVAVAEKSEVLINSQRARSVQDQRIVGRYEDRGKVQTKQDELQEVSWEKRVQEDQERQKHQVDSGKAKGDLKTITIPRREYYREEEEEQRREILQGTALWQTEESEVVAINQVCSKYTTYLEDKAQWKIINGIIPRDKIDWSYVNILEYMENVNKE